MKLRIICLDTKLRESAAEVVEEFSAILKCCFEQLLSKEKLEPGSQMLKGREILGQPFLKRSTSRSYF